MNILFVDDDSLIQESVKLWLKNEFTLVPAFGFDEAVRIAETKEIDGAIIDINLGDTSKNGIELLKVFKQKYPDMPVVMISGQNEATVIVNCIRLGADDFIEKPFEGQSLFIRISKAFSDTRKNRVFKRAFELASDKNQIIGKSQGVQRARRFVEQAGRMRILFQGETGVGKTPFAWYSNQLVSQEDAVPRPFEQINCAGLSNERFQDQLFGHKKGAYTGAISDKRGMVELAKGGDLFLDEIGEMPLDTQALFLTFLDSQEYYRLGDDQKRRADVRILCATNRDLKQMVVEGSFRKDLYSRISQVVVEIPPLRHRTSDIPALLEHFIQQFSGYQKPYASEVLDILLQQPWDEGNVREFRDAVEYLSIMGRDSEVLHVNHLSDRIKPIDSASGLPKALGAGPEKWLTSVSEHGLEGCLNAVEKNILDHYYRTCEGNIDNMAKTLRTSKPTLYRRLRQYGISSTDAGSADHGREVAQSL